MLVSPLTMFPVVIFNEMHAKSFGLFFRIRQLDTSIRCQILSNSLIIVVRSLTLDCQSQVETKFYLVLESLSAMDLGVKVFVGLGLVVVAGLCLYIYTTLSIIEKERSNYRVQFLSQNKKLLGLVQIQQSACDTIIISLFYFIVELSLLLCKFFMFIFLLSSLILFK